MHTSIDLRLHRLLFLVAVFVSSASFAEDPSQRRPRHATASILVAPEVNAETTNPHDRRVRISGMRPVNGISDEAVAFARLVTSTIFEISESTLSGKKLNNFSGSAFLLKNPYCNGGYVLSARHNVNASEKVVGKNGRVSDQPTNHDPIGAKVVLRHGLDGSGIAQLNSGTVIAKGGLIGTNSDWVIIRLDAPSIAMPLDITKGTKDEIVGSRLMSFGLPDDMSRQGNRSEVVVDPKCKGIRLSQDGGLITNCVLKAGNSGGPLAVNIAADGQPEKWKLIGMAITAQKEQSEFLIISEVSAIFATQIRDHVAKNPCK